MSTGPELLIVGGGSDESVDVCAGTEEPSTAEVGGVGCVFVVAVVGGRGTAEDVAGVEVDVEVDVERIVGGFVSTVSTGVPDDAEVEADESPPSLHPPTTTATSATSTTLDRRLIRTIMSSWVTKLSAMRDNGARLAIANLSPSPSDSDSTATGQDSQ